MKLWPVEHFLNTFFNIFVIKIIFSSNQNIGEGESNFDDKYVQKVFNWSEFHLSEKTLLQNPYFSSFCTITANGYSNDWVLSFQLLFCYSTSIEISVKYVLLFIFKKTNINKINWNDLTRCTWNSPQSSWRSPSPSPERKKKSPSPRSKRSYDKYRDFRNLTQERDQKLRSISPNKGKDL